MSRLQKQTGGPIALVLKQCTDALLLLSAAYVTMPG